MELQKFISKTLTEIQRGVHSAIKEKKDDDKGAINPVFGDVDSIGEQHVQEVKFDIAVTISESSSSSAGGGIKVVGLNIGGDTTGSAESSHVSRIQFTIPIIPPVETVQKKKTNDEL